MNVEEVREYCLTKPGTTESFPFDETTLVFKVANKMFALLNIDGNNTLNLKCDPEKAVQLREEHAAVLPGYHMNKTHWNTVCFGEGVTVQQLQEWIDHSYQLIVKSLPKKDRQMLEDLGGLID